MRSSIFRWRAVRFVIAAGLLAALVPVSAGADGHEATLTEVTFTSTVVEVLEEGEFWIDDAGIGHVRGAVNEEEISGDISGTAIVEVNVDFEPEPGCDLTETEDCPGFISVWGSVEVSDEAGRWNGDFMQLFSTVEGEEEQFSSVVLRGSGDNAGMSFVGEFVEETEDSVTIAGQMLTMAMPVQGLNLSTNFCFNEDGSTTGGAMSEGAIAASGDVELAFIGAGSRWTHRYGLWGVTEYSDEHGSVLLVFGGNAQDHPESSNGWGHFVILDGEGAYAELYGHGRVTGWIGGAPNCASGGGGHLTYYGQAHYN